MRTSHSATMATPLQEVQYESHSFAIDVLECARCHGAMRILAVIHPPDTTAAILACQNLPTRAPPTEPASPDQELADSQQAEW